MCNPESSFPQVHVIPAPTRSLIHKLSELGHLYSRVSAFVKDREGRHSVGLIEQVHPVRETFVKLI